MATGGIAVDVAASNTNAAGPSRSGAAFSGNFTVGGHGNNPPDSSIATNLGTIVWPIAIAVVGGIIATKLLERRKT